MSMYQLPIEEQILEFVTRLIEKFQLFISNYLNQKKSHSKYYLYWSVNELHLAIAKNGS